MPRTADSGVRRRTASAISRRIDGRIEAGIRHHTMRLE
jgi:hypothetical protein